MALAAALQSKKASLRAVPTDACNDRSSANVSLAGKDVLEDEAQIIVDHWDARRKLLAAEQDASTSEPAVDKLLAAALDQLEPLAQRLEGAVRIEAAQSSADMAFIKLSTRSPKDSKKALARAKQAYARRLEEMRVKLGKQDVDKEESKQEVPENTRWRILSEEVTRAGAVANGAAALELLLDSERVFEDLEYALRGPPVEGSNQPLGSVSQDQRAWDMSLVARAWDPRLTIESEFRGICWDGRLTCLCQYFHPLHFPEIASCIGEIENDVKRLVEDPAVAAAIARLGGHCIVDFAWLGPGEVLIVELNPFDGVCLGTFPASTGLFLWDNPEDRAVMRGEAPFQFRIRDGPLDTPSLKTQCNPDWRSIIYGSR